MERAAAAAQLAAAAERTAATADDTADDDGRAASADRAADAAPIGDAVVPPPPPPALPHGIVAAAIPSPSPNGVVGAESLRTAAAEADKRRRAARELRRVRRQFVRFLERDRTALSDHLTDQQQQLGQLQAF